MGRPPSVARKRPPGPSLGTQGVLRFLHQPSPLLLALPLVLTAVAYGKVLRGGFVFDDRITALSPAVKDLGAQARALLPALLRGGRPVVDLSLALNHAAGGAEAWSYHAVNIAIHLATVLLVFAFTARTLHSRACRACAGSLSLWPGFLPCTPYTARPSATCPSERSLSPRRST
jgi:hypothetical protein